MKQKGVTFIAEIGMNYNTNFGTAYEMIRQAKLAGADIAKFQLGWRDKPGEINCISKEDIEQMIQWAKFYDIQLMFSIISQNAYELFKDFTYFPAVKIASRTTAKEPELVKNVLDLGLTTYVSFGMSDVNDFAFEKSDKMHYLFCISEYPTFYDRLKTLPKDFNDSPFDGYSDHTLGNEACYIAISRGARIIEKHFTLDKSDSTIRDHALSATPEEFAELVRIGSSIHKIVSVL